ncbi:hypothetical protein K2173_017795 [Erythroxylum novogranatense]|uniref:GH18 domain-containing protein n=1 Tax=Erythroxylum novogranatense TaxID=1862640 RepID=A0AAV8SLQ1_9ROSI|nr:hypothetical protein K2173_017795 [Erythroxylum novogranatense]
MSSEGAMGSPQAIKGAYYPSWSEILLPSDIDTTLFTHIFYAFLSPDNNTYKFKVSDSTGILLTNFTTILHQKASPVKTLVSFAGVNGDKQFYARMVSQPVTRGIFINSAIDVARRYGFDGLDLDWEFPQTTQEMEDLGQLFGEWRHAINEEASLTRRPSLLLTAAVTGAHALLYDPTSNISTSYGLNSWLGTGLPRTMLVIGLPQYGRTWQLKDPNVNGIGAPALGPGPINGVLTFRQLERRNEENRATVVFDPQTVSTYSYAGTLWVGYDDMNSTAAKLSYARDLKLLGYFFWALSFDNEWKLSRLASGSWSE